MAYAFPGEGALDYFPCRYGASRLIFRGPRRSLERPYIAFLGGTETYGKYVHDPYPDLVEYEVGLASINLACVNAGLDVYLNEPEVLRIAQKAKAVVIQIVGAHNVSNRYYAVHPRRNDRFLGATPLLKSMYREVDFTEFNFTRHMLMSLHAVSQRRFEVLAEELRLAWVSRMTQLLSLLPNRTVLVWISKDAPPQVAQHSTLNTDPTLVDADMITALRPRVAAYVEAISSSRARAEGLSGMSFAPLEAPAAASLPGPAVHRDVALVVSEALLGLI